MENLQKIEIQEPEYYPKKSKSPLKSIRYFCFECMGWSRAFEDAPKPIEDVRDCTDGMCPLFDFRYGKNPHSKQKGNVQALELARKKKSH